MEDFNSKYTGQQVEALLDKVASGNAGGGDITEVYITDFDVYSIESLMRNAIPHLWLDKQGLMDALVAHKVILVPYEISDNSTAKGYCTLVGFYEDLIYIKVITEYSEIIIETALDTQYILSQEVTKRNWADKQDVLKSGENIKTFNGESLLGEGDITTPTFLRIGDTDNEAWANFIAVANREKSADYYICSSKVLGTPIHGIATKLDETGPTNSPVYVRYTIYGSTTSGELAGKLLKITTTLTTATGATTTITEAIIDTKQDAITDLEDIREGAAKGATSAQLYITPFDVLSLYALAQNPVESGGIDSDNKAITDALAANKTILVPYAIGDESVRGYAPLVGYAEDLLYFKVITDSYEICVETSRDADDILGQEVTYRDWHSKQDFLVSGENIKTINGESILGSGNITISGGTDTKEIVEITGTSGTIEEFMPNKIYVHTSPTYNIDIWEYITTDAAVDEYITYFRTGTPSLGGGWTPYYSFPDGTLWANGVYPETEPNTLYELSIVKTTINGVDYFKAVLTPFKPVE